MSDVKRPSIFEHRASLLALATIAVSIAVAGIKYLAYVVTGSVALYSDALESTINVATAVASLLAIRYSLRPADRTHQFGHHKVEYFSSVLEGALIIIAAFFILREAYAATIEPRTLSTPYSGLAINTVAIIINAGWAWLIIARGRAEKSPALIADGQHLLVDVATSIGVNLGLVLSVVTGYGPLDPILAAVVAVHILVSGWRIATSSLSSLMDEAVPLTDLSRIRTTISANADGAIEVHDLRTRVAGNKTFIEFHLVVPAAMTVAAAHAICDRIEVALEAVQPGSDVLIHVEPEGEARHTGVVVL